MTQFEELQQAIIDGKAPVAKELTEKMLKEGVRPGEFFPKAIIPAMDEVGRRMRECEFFIPEVLIAARAARASSDILRPLLVGDEAMTVRRHRRVRHRKRRPARHRQEHRGHDAGKRGLQDC